MSREVRRRGSSQIQIGPGKKVLVPLALIGVAALLATDVTHWHLLHHLLGASSVLVVPVLIIVAVVWGWRKIRRG